MMKTKKWAANIFDLYSLIKCPHIIVYLDKYILVKQNIRFKNGFQEHTLQIKNNDTNSLARESINSKFGLEQIRYGPECTNPIL